MDFSLPLEKQLLMQERRLFLEKEIKYFGFICKNSENEKERDPFYLYGQDYSNRLLRILCDIKTYEEACDEASNEGLKNLITVESVYAMLPTLFQNLNNAHLIRKHKRLRLGQPVTKPIFALSEVHPDYAQTIRAIEAVNSAYNKNLSKFLERFEFIPPILVMSRSSFWGLYGFPDEDNYFFKYEDYIIESRRKLINYFLILSWISLPRWVPIQMRFAPFLAHENFHRVLQIAIFATDDLKRIRSKSDADMDENVRYLENQLYGPNIIRIMRYYHAIGIGLEKFLTALRFPDPFVKNLLSSEPETPMVAKCYWTDSLGNIQMSAFSMANEIMSDIAAALIAGPSYLLSMLCDPGWMNKGTLLSITPMYIATHPPLINRIELLIEVLAYYKFERTAAMCKELLKQYLAKVSLTSEEGRTVEAYRNLFLGQIEFFYETANCLYELMPHCAGGRIKRGGLTEEKWIEEKEYIMSKALSGSFHEIDTAPEEVINTIWYKKVFHPELSGIQGHTAWRILLCNC